MKKLSIAGNRKQQAFIEGQKRRSENAAMLRLRMKTSFHRKNSHS